MTFFIGFLLTKSAVIRARSSFSNINVKWNNINTNELITITISNSRIVRKEK